jgi:hypothetical protein
LAAERAVNRAVEPEILPLPAALLEFRPCMRELETALARDMRVIPVLVGGAGMPRPEELPPVLAPLTRRHASRFSAPATSG